MNSKRLQAIVKDIRGYCVAHSNPARAGKYAKFFTEGYDAYGLDKDELAQLLEEINAKYGRDLDPAGALRLGDLLLESGKYEEASFAVVMLKWYEDDYSIDTFNHLGQWLENGIRNWAHTDVLCCEAIPAFFEKTIVQPPDFDEWKASRGKWRRRAVPVSFLTPLKNGNDVKSLLDLIDSMMMDEDRFVQQGLGWFLREAWKRQPAPVETFLLKWKNAAPRKIFQYATEKMGKEDKERFRREKRKP